MLKNLLQKLEQGCSRMRPWLVPVYFPFPRFNWRWYVFNTLHTTGFFVYLLKTSENFWFCDHGIIGVHRPPLKFGSPLNLSPLLISKLQVLP